MTERLEAARSMRESARRLRNVAYELEPRLAAELLWIALDLDKEAIELDAAFRAKLPIPANDEDVA